MTKIVADVGINWNFLYEVVYEDDLILVLKDLGGFHKFDEDRKFKGKVDEYFDFLGKSSVMIGGKSKLVEIKKSV